jgi:hypothetical protein
VSDFDTQQIDRSYLDPETKAEAVRYLERTRQRRHARPPRPGRRPGSQAPHRDLTGRLPDLRQEAAAARCVPAYGGVPEGRPGPR